MSLPAATQLNQVAYIVDDLSEAIEWWTRVMRVGPFLRLDTVQFDEADYRGAAADISFGVAMAYSGNVLVELIEPRSPSIFQEYRQAGKTGVQHLAVFSDDFAATEAAVIAGGGVRLQGARSAGGRFGYYDMGGGQSVVLEIAQLSAEGKALFAALRRAAEEWDGKQACFVPG